MPMTIEVTDLPERLQELLQIVESGTEVLLRDGDAMATLTTAKRTREPHAILNPANEVLFSHTCVLEMEIKVQTGKLVLTKSIDQIITEQLRVNGMRELPQSLDHIRGLRTLPLIHRDPFDRLLIAQAIYEQALFVTDDRMISQYSVPIFWK